MCGNPLSPTYLAQAMIIANERTYLEVRYILYDGDRVQTDGQVGSSRPNPLWASWAIHVPPLL